LVRHRPPSLAARLARRIYSAHNGTSRAHLIMARMPRLTSTRYSHGCHRATHPQARLCRLWSLTDDLARASATSLSEKLARLCATCRGAGPAADSHRAPARITNFSQQAMGQPSHAGVIQVALVAVVRGQMSRRCSCAHSSHKRLRRAFAMLGASAT